MPPTAIPHEPDIILRSMLAIPSGTPLGEHLRALQKLQDAARLERHPTDPDLELLLRVAGVDGLADGTELDAQRITEAAATAALMRIAVAVPNDWRAAAWWLEHRYDRIKAEATP